jgi:hypothetical protein
MSGISKLLVAESADLAGFLPERLAPILLAAQDQFKFSHIVAGASAVSRSVTLMAASLFLESNQVIVVIEMIFI